jgi:hypothetical protein
LPPSALCGAPFLDLLAPLARAEACSFSDTSCFGGALTDGWRWEFHVVVRNEQGGWRDYAMPLLTTDHDKETIIQVLAKMVCKSFSCVSSLIMAQLISSEEELRTFFVDQ